MMLPIISVLIGISLMYYIRQKRAEKEMDEIVNSISPSNDRGFKRLCLYYNSGSSLGYGRFGEYPRCREYEKGS